MAKRKKPETPAPGLGAATAPPQQARRPLLGDKRLDLPVANCVPAPWNARADIADGLDDLVADVALVGVQLPVMARPHPTLEGHYEIMAGCRRLAAAKRAGELTIPAVVCEAISDREARRLTWHENLCRKDLAPLEQAGMVRELLACEGDGKPRSEAVASVASELGKSVRWVYGMLALDRLSPAVRKAWADPLSPIYHWPASNLAVLARLDEATQDAALRLLGGEGGHYVGDEQTQRYRSFTPDDLEAYIDRQLLHRLASAAWKLDDGELEPKAGACTACPKQTLAADRRDLWHESDTPPAELLKAARCLDVNCWQRKADAVLKRLHAAAAAKTPDGKVLVVTSEKSRDWALEGRQKAALGLPADGYRADQDEMNYESATEGDEGAVPAIVVGMEKPTINWLKPKCQFDAKGRQVFGGAKTPAAAPTLDDKREGLRWRRMKLATARLLARAKAVAGLDDRQQALLRLILAFRLLGARNNALWDTGDCNGWAAYDKADKLSMNDTMAQLGEALAAVFEERFASLAQASCAGSRLSRTDAEAKSLSAALDLDWQVCLAEAESEIPEPKSWGSAPADKKPKAKAKAKSKKPAPAPEPPEPRSDDDDSNEE